MLIDVAIAMLCALVGFAGAIWLLIVFVGEGIANPVIPYADDPILGPRDPVAIHDGPGDFIPMPAHLKTRDEMVEWMVKELPKLTADAAPGGPGPRND